MPTETEIFETLLAMEHAALDRWGKGDPSGYLEIYDDDIVYFDPYRERRVDGLPALTLLYESWRGQIQIASYEILNPKVQAWNSGAVLTFNYASTGYNGQITRWNCTEVYRLTAAGWRIIQSHWSYTNAVG